MEGGTRQQLAALTADTDTDPFEPEAEVDFGTDFLPSTNPLALLSQLPPAHSISQSLELLPASFLAQVREQREFEDSVADLREDSAAPDLELAHTEQQEEEDEDRLLELQLVELTSKLDRMETEMCLVSEESKNLQQALEIKDSVIVDQVAVLLQHFAQTAF